VDCRFLHCRLRYVDCRAQMTSYFVRWRPFRATETHAACAKLLLSFELRILSVLRVFCPVALLSVFGKFITSVTMFGCSYIYFMQGLEIVSDCTRKPLRTPKIHKFSCGSMPPDPPRGGGPRGPTRCPGYSMLAILVIFPTPPSQLH